VIITEKKLRKIISNIITEALSESFGVAHGVEDLARYIIKRCASFSHTAKFRAIRNKGYVGYAFTLPNALLQKYTKYDIGNERLQVYWEPVSDEHFAQIRKMWGEYALCLNSRFFNANAESNATLIEHVSHELTHFINGIKSATPFGNRQIRTTKNRWGSGAMSLCNDILYYFEDTEMNARLTQFYYELKNKYSVRKDEDGGILADANGRITLFDKNNFENLKKASRSLRYDEMLSAYNAIMREKPYYYGTVSYGVDSFPVNPTGKEYGPGEFGKERYNIYFAILCALKGESRKDILDIPPFEYFYGKGTQKWADGNWKNFYNRADTAKLTMQFVLLRNKVRNQLSQKMSDFSRKADRIIYEWLQENGTNP
jgi:hypothetical protein